MALTLDQCAKVVADTGYAARVRAAMLRCAFAVFGEAQGAMTPTVWGKRRQLSTAVLRSPDAYLAMFLGEFAADGGLSLTWYQPVNIASSTNANPSVVTTATAHGLVVGDVVEITGHLVNTNLNSMWTVATVADTTHFTVPYPANGLGAATGTAMKMESDVTVNFTVGQGFSPLAGLLVTD
jgi:hypothetical protein